MKASMKVSNQIEDVEMSLTLTMSVGDWRRILDQSNVSSYPSWKVRDIIRRAISEVTTHIDKMVEVLPIDDD